MDINIDLHHELFSVVNDLFDHRHDDPNFAKLVETVHDYVQINDGAGDDGDVLITHLNIHLRKQPDPRRVEAAVEEFGAYGMTIEITVLK